jgi:phage tail-like protein
VTQAAALLPPVPAPPHDPYSIVLDWRAGWRMSGAVTNVELSPLDHALVLQPAPNGTAPLADAFGTFGGLVLPDNAVYCDGLLLLLDRKHTRMLRFDPCDCVFVPVPCIAGKGSKPRQLKDPGGMVASCGNLYVCDTGNARVQVFGLRGLPLRAIWQQPVTLPQPWLPVAAAADRRGHIYIGDRNNGMVHVFAATGRYLRSLDDLGAIEHLTVDCDGRLYVQVQGVAAVSIIDPHSWLDTHTPLETQTRADEVAKRFPKLPFVVTPDGHFKLCGGEFDDDGDPVDPPEALPGPSYQTTGSMITVALDSAIYRCVWDRLELDGDFPDGTGVVASVYTSETPIPDAIIDTLTDEWVDCVPCDNVSHPWDCMLNAPPGRYLWLRLAFTSHGEHTPRIRKARIVFPRVGLRRYLPGTYGSDVAAGEFTDRFLAIFDRTFRGIESTVDWQAHFYDPLSAPADDHDRRNDFLSWLGTWIGVTLDRSWPIARRRRYLKMVGKLLPLRGTLPGLRKNLQLFLGLPLDDDCRQTTCVPCPTKKPPRWKPPELILEHYRLRRWMFLGAGRLGDEARLWGDSIVNRSRLDGKHCRGNAQTGVTTLNTTQDPLRDPFWVYAHKLTVFAPASCAATPAAQRALDRLVRAERPAHVAYQIVYVEPRFRIGVQSMIGYDTAVGRYPNANIRLGEARLGRATMLGGDGPGDSMTVGKESRIGSSTRLK